MQALKYVVAKPIHGRVGGSKIILYKLKNVASNSKFMVNEINLNLKNYFLFIDVLCDLIISSWFFLSDSFN